VARGIWVVCAWCIQEGGEGGLIISDKYLAKPVKVVLLFLFFFFFIFHRSPERANERNMGKKKQHKT
jgi:hypothetical protein